jgi:hypothetical protein
MGNGPSKAPAPAGNRQDDEEKGTNGGTTPVIECSADALPYMQVRTWPTNMRITAKQNGHDCEKRDK